MVIAQGIIEDIKNNKSSQIGPFLSGKDWMYTGNMGSLDEMFSGGKIHLSTGPIHTVKLLEVDIPKGKLTVVTGVSGSGKTTMILESLVPGLEALIGGQKLPEHVLSLSADGIEHVKLIDAAPIGINVRSTVATYANVHDELRKIYARTQDAKRFGYKAGDFSYNTGLLRCPCCDGTGTISLDVQFLPDVDVPCADCRGSRYGKMAYGIRHTNKDGASYSLPELMDMDVNTALKFCRDMKNVYQRLLVLQSLGLHPLDVKTLLGVFEKLIENGATVIVIEHDLDVIRNADYVIDMGPGGGEEGGRIVAAGTPSEIADHPESVTGKFL